MTIHHRDAESRIYLDHCATTPLREEVFEAMAPYLREHFGNAGSPHRFGREARRAVESARESVAALIGAQARDIVFTSGGTESNHLALGGVLQSDPRPFKRLITSAIEHPSVLEKARSLASSGAVDLGLLPVDGQGKISLEEFEQAAVGEVALVSVMHANNETGVIQPIEALAALCRDRGFPFHSDAAQSAGKLALDVNAAGIDLLTLVAHKLYGPKGVGACYVRPGTRLSSQLVGGAQERRRRAGTENVAGIVGFGVACSLAQADMQSAAVRMQALRDRLENTILDRIKGAWFSGVGHPRLPHVLNAGFEGADGESLVYLLDVGGIAISTGSACSSGSAEPSPVLLAMGQDHARALAAIRISLGRETTDGDIDRAVDVLEQAVASQRRSA